MVTVVHGRTGNTNIPMVIPMYVPYSQFKVKWEYVIFFHTSVKQLPQSLQGIATFYEQFYFQQCA